MRIRECAARDAKEFFAWNEAIGERLITLLKQRDHFSIEKIGRANHGGFVMAIETKDVRNETDRQVVLGKAQPHIVVFPAEPADLAQGVVVAAEFQENIATKHSHGIHVGGLNKNLRVPIIVG